MPDITEQVDGASTVLLASPSIGSRRQVCSALLTDPPVRSVLFVSYVRGPDRCVGQLERAGADEVDVEVLAVGGVGADGSAGHDDAAVRQVSTPGDLTRLGVEIDQFLSERAAPVSVCFDSLTSLLQYVDLDTAYEFLHVVTGQVRAADARAHFHVDPGAHDDADIAAVTSLFDASVSVGDERRVRTREYLSAEPIE
jgi:hypothetical protein